MAGAVDVFVDDERQQVVLLTPGAKRPHYDALLGPFTAGSHEVRLAFSPLWPRDGALDIHAVSIDVVTPADRRFDILAHAPTIGLRPDTIGNASDLPLLMYVEEAAEKDARWLRYSVIFSHEDGGTPGPALMARWGRTTDIELAYEVELRGRRTVHARYQGPDHRINQTRDDGTRSPFLLVATLNNMFLDRGRSAAVVRPFPVLIDLSTRSRESVMDDEPWIYRVMARELAAEGRTDVGDPRDYVYVDLRLASRGAGIALGARTADGVTRWSDRGRPELVVSRQGEMRIAVPAPATDRLAALSVRCDPREDPKQTTETPGCEVEFRKAFRLDSDHQPGPALRGQARLALGAGTARDLTLAPDRIE
jgi:hypothetical protein